MKIDITSVVGVLLIIALATATVATSSALHADSEKQSSSHYAPQQRFLFTEPKHHHFAASDKKTFLKNTQKKSAEQVCIGDFQECPGTGECSLVSSYCGKGDKSTCTPGSYICPPVSSSSFKKNVGAPKVVCAPKFSQCPGLKGTFWDWTLSIDERLDLISKAVTVDEQSWQLQNSNDAIERLYIPQYQWLNDDLHGLRGNWTTDFPDSCALGATWSHDTLKNVGWTIGREAREVHHFFTSRGERAVSPVQNGWGLTAYAPMINLVRDPRWGRNQEAYGEDPKLVGDLARSYVEGMQEQRPLLSEGGQHKVYQAVSCCKHFAAYDVESFPVVRYKYNAVVNGRNLMESYLPAFYSCVAEANARHVMCSYNSLNGIPTCADPGLLNYTLRERYNFTGFVVSDYDAWENLYITHHYVDNFTAAAAVGINAGMDQEGGGFGAIEQLPAAIKLGTVSPATVTRSFQRTWRVRFELGMFDPPEFVYFANLSSAHVGDDKHEQSSLDAAREAACLYRNAKVNASGGGEAIPAIPLQIDSANKKKTLVVGPKAASANWYFGNYADRPIAGTVSALEGIMNSACPYEQNAFVPPVTHAGFSVLPPSYMQQYAPVIAVNSTDCFEKCMTTLKCNFFTFFAKGQACYLLPVQGDMKKTRGAESGARYGLSVTTAGQTYTTSSSKGDDDIAVHADDARECSQKCRVSETCVVFTFDRAFQKCFLLPAHRASAGPRPAPASVISGRSPLKCLEVDYAEACAEGSLECLLPTGFDEAVERAAKSSGTILLFGLDQNIEREGHDRRTIDLPYGQYALIDLLRSATSEAGVPFVGVMIHGGAFRIDPTKFDALLDFFYPGQLGGTAIGETVFGLNMPAGRSTITWYANDKDLPPNLAQQDFYPTKTSKGYTYRYTTAKPVIPFGHGLTFTNFKYTNLVVTPAANVLACDVIKVQVTIVPSGNIGSDEVVQLYVKQYNASVPVPKIRLADFRRVKMPKEPTTVSLEIHPRFRCSVMQNDDDIYKSREVIESGVLELFVGGGQPGFYVDGVSTTVNVLSPDNTPIDDCPKP